MLNSCYYFFLLRPALCENLFRIAWVFNLSMVIDIIILEDTLFLVLVIGVVLILIHWIFIIKLVDFLLLLLFFNPMLRDSLLSLLRTGFFNWLLWFFALLLLFQSLYFSHFLLPYLLLNLLFVVPYCRQLPYLYLFVFATAEQLLSLF